MNDEIGKQYGYLTVLEDTGKKCHSGTSISAMATAGHPFCSGLHGPDLVTAHEHPLAGSDVKTIHSGQENRE